MHEISYLPIPSHYRHLAAALNRGNARNAAETDVARTGTPAILDDPISAVRARWIVADELLFRWIGMEAGVVPPRIIERL
jgi:hypothetical protein